MGSLKQALARVARKKQSNDWASLLPTVTKGQNGLPNEHYLDGDNPKKARTDKELEKELIKKNQEFDKEVEELESEKRELRLKLEEVSVPLALAGVSKGEMDNWIS